MARAQAENRLILTFDKDFGELAFRTRFYHGVALKGFETIRAGQFL